MDILRIVAAPALEVRKKTMNLALDLVTSRNIEEVGKLDNEYVFIFSEVAVAHCEK